jgi:hypothetical protein
VEPENNRKLTVFDTMVLLAATALALAAVSDEWPLAWEVFRKVDVSHFREDTFPGRNFHAKPQTGRLDSMGLTTRKMLRPFVGARRQWRGWLKPDGTQATYPEWLENWGLSRTNRRAGGRAAGYAAAGEIYVLAFPFLTVWTTALVGLRLRAPRPPRERLWRQPGWWACVATVAGMLAALAEEAVIEFPCPTGVVPLTVLLTWLGLALSRRWLAESSWIDRAGRALGLAWVVMVPLYLVGFVLTHTW